jgi:hypothetical protein
MENKDQDDDHDDHDDMKQRALTITTVAMNYFFVSTLHK